ncbi:hypothetical protein H8S10_11975 [Clostridium sp. NSJ-49]|uniref:hypothetical protein n=1 Tax=Clostridium TaxID=1485 RepID=UPI00164A1C16|nr:hypothetical protein [Clostridium sp. NSJ-49]MBC5626175.1 hypothetical protein [Clostridium sp. NSJ-49]
MIRIKEVEIISNTSWLDMMMFNSWNSIYRNFPHWKFYFSNIAIVNTPITIKVTVEEADWGNVKGEVKDWNGIKAFKNWQAVKDF